MISAVRKSKCTNLNALPLDAMTAEKIYEHLLEARCPCLQKLLKQSKLEAVYDLRQMLYIDYS